MENSQLPETELELLFERQQEGGYHVYCPQLPGLHTEGETLEEAQSNAREALELYAEAMAEEGKKLDLARIRPHFRGPQ